MKRKLEDEPETEDRSEVAEEDPILLKIRELNTHIAAIEAEINEMKAADPQEVVEGEGLNQKLTKFLNLLTHIYDQKLQVLIVKEELNEMYQGRILTQDFAYRNNRIQDSEEKLKEMNEEALNLKVCNFKELEDLIKKFYPSTFIKHENNCDINMNYFVGLWDEQAEKGREEGNISFMELENYRPLWANIRFLGYQISQLLIDFLILGFYKIWLLPVTWRVESTLEELRMEGREKSPIIDSFLKVTQSVDVEDLGLRPGRGGYGMTLSESFMKKEKHIGISILKEILYLEFAFCCPFLPMDDLTTGSLEAFTNYLRARVRHKKKSIGMEINKRKKELPEENPFFRDLLYLDAFKVWLQKSE